MTQLQIINKRWIKNSISVLNAFFSSPEGMTNTVQAGFRFCLLELFSSHFKIHEYLTDPCVLQINNNFGDRSPPFLLKKIFIGAFFYYKYKNFILQRCQKLTSNGSKVQKTGILSTQTIKHVLFDEWVYQRSISKTARELTCNEKEKIICLIKAKT
ncbi:hypothetical protein BpHYR1_049130 [Brachionus plicatilis]|uniref:Uncharacterized protein n=1 Tax=Brachionus plicatilis TaxID=10195 RepID=A0A3M7SKC6_BRAPC|nr:hypothetical protein BpHYR1_049130 [Brachionus plicatilis]